MFVNLFSAWVISCDLVLHFCGRCVGPIVSVLVPGSSGLGTWPWLETLCCFLGQNSS